MFIQGLRCYPASSTVAASAALVQQQHHHPASNGQIQQNYLIALNAEAAMLLQQGLCAESVLLLSTGLRWLELYDREIAGGVVPSNCEVAVLPVLSDGNQHVENHFSLFDRAAVLTVKNEEKPMPPIISRNEMAAVFLYNLGLAYNLMGIRQSENRQRFLLVALLHYKAATEILPWKSNTLANDKLLALSLINNQGYIYALLQETNKANECLMLLEARLSESDCVNEADETMMHFHLSVAIRSKGMGQFMASPAA